MTLSAQRAAPAHGAAAPPLPVWVRLLDATALLMIAMAALLIAGDGVRFTVGSVRIAISSAFRVAGWAVLTIAVRHALYRSPTLPTRIAGWIERGRVHADVPFVARLVLATR